MKHFFLCINSVFQSKNYQKNIFYIARGFELSSHYHLYPKFDLTKTN